MARRAPCPAIASEHHEIVKGAGDGAVGGAPHGLLDLFFLNPSSYIAWGGILFALLVFALSRSSLLSPAKVLDGGLVFMVVGAACISALTFWGILPGGQPDPLAGNNFMGVPWEAIWIVIFPLIAPNKPSKVLIAAFLAVVFLNQNLTTPQTLAIIVICSSVLVEVIWPKLKPAAD